MRAWWLVFVVACGDNRAVPDGAPDADALPALDCSALSAETMVGGLDGIDDVAATDDNLEIWVPFSEFGSYPRIEVATRPDVTSPFGAPMSPTNPIGFDRETWSPTLSRDGLEVVFLSAHMTVDGAVCRMSRTSRSAAFEGPDCELTPASATALDLSWDGRTLYAKPWPPDGRVFAWRRVDLQSAFADTTVAADIDARDFTVSSDELEMFYVLDDEVFFTRRPSRDAVWKPGSRVGAGRHVELTPDDQTLYVVHDGHVWAMTRSCHPAD
jgi:hypothetical protein